MERRWQAPPEGTSGGVDVVLLVEVRQGAPQSLVVVPMLLLDRFQLWLQRLESRLVASLERTN
jgi:hypothetical protein